MNTTLLSTKFYIPPARLNAVARPRLTEALLAVLSQPGSFALLSGPAGFGKTTLLSEFAAACGRPVAWLSLDEGDNDPIQFWSYVIAALQAVQAEIGEAALALLATPQSLPAETIPSLLINDLAGLKRDCVLALDDYHIIQNEAIHTAFRFLLEHIPEKLHIILSTRVDPPWPLARFRVRNQLIEIRANDLRFSIEEAALFLNRLMKLELSGADVETLETRTEGWIAGLQLAALSMKGRHDIAGFMKAFTGSHLYIAEYLVEEVFKNQPAELQSFLLQSSILERLNAGLCEAVTGCADGQATLIALQRANLFVTPLDDEGQWFRYHHLFSDLLKARLKQSTTSATLRDLHERAAAWYAQAGMDAEAIEQSLAAENYPAVLSILEEIALPLILQAHVRTVEGWLRAIPPEFLEKRPKINLACAWMYLLRGLVDLAGPYLEQLKRYFSQVEAGKEDPALLGGWLALQARLLNAQGEAQESIRLGSQALKLLPEADFNVRTLVQLELATANQQLADYEQAAEIFLTVARNARARGDFVAELLGISGGARMMLQQGKLRLACQAAQEGLDRVEASGKITPFSATLFGELGQVYYQWHRLEQAEEFIQRSVQASGHSGYIDPEMHYHVMRSRICQMSGDWNDAEAEMQRVAELMRISPPAMIRESVIAQQARVDLAFGRVQNVQAALQKEGIDPDRFADHSGATPAASFTEPFGWLYNSALRYQLSLARSNPSGVDLNRLAKAAGDAFAALLQNQQIPTALETLLLRSQMFAVLGDEAHSLADLAQAVDLAAPEGFISVFVEEGPLVAQGLLALSRRSPPGTGQSGFIQEVLAAFPVSQQPASPSDRRSTPEAGFSKEKPRGDEALTPFESLTNRETEVLRLIAAGDSNQAIAEKLVISLSAVKKHTANIYGKLNVGSRTQAVARARQLGLLPAD